ncbi:tRNA-dependent cyclodipeptide synthase [Streptomyces sp. TRM43335]|uniref:Cyclodipeptide synthase n=1 Tax=Streptomyces taklimakanensis TaxID=2569853 RepID=A0A6G2B5N3_9ACTN|nr:tRNA-dependent cyclodipeptide synthase [Streptomyces taklimakanensis]
MVNDTEDGGRRTETVDVPPPRRTALRPAPGPAGSPPALGVPDVPSPRRRYMAEIAAVSPVTDRHGFEEHDRCFLGVSMGNPSFEDTELEAILRWISRRFSHCTVLVGDVVYRLTLQSTRELSPESALHEAFTVGRRFVDGQRRRLDTFRDCTDFTFLTCGEVQAGPTTPRTGSGSSSSTTTTWPSAPRCRTSPASTSGRTVPARTTVWWSPASPGPSSTSWRSSPSSPVRRPGADP